MINLIRWFLGVLLILLFFTSVFGSEDVRIVDVQLEKDVFYPGELIKGKVTIENDGDYPVAYRFAYLYNNKLIEKGDINYVQPGYYATEDFYVEVPDADILHLTFRIWGMDFYDEESTYYLISKRVKDFLFFAPYELEVNAGDSAELILNIYNIGNQPDTYKITCDYENSDISEKSVSLNSGENKTVIIYLNTSKEDKMDYYNITVKVCGEEACKSKKIILFINKPEDEQSIITLNQTEFEFEKNTSIEFNVTIKNIGIDVKEYKISLDKVNYSVTPDKIILDPEEEKNITITLFPTEDVNATLKIFSNGIEIYKQKIILKEKENMFGLTGFFVYEGKVWIPGFAILSALAIAFVLYYFYKDLRKKLLVEKTVAYNVSRNPYIKR